MRTLKVLSSLAIVALVASACSTVQPMGAPGVAPTLEPEIYAAYQDGTGTGTDGTGTDTNTGTSTETTPPAPTDTQAVVEEIPPLNNDDPTVLAGAFEFKLSKDARLISYEDEWTNLKGERESLPLVELAGTNPYLLMKRVISVGVTEVTKSASGSTDPETRSWVKQDVDDLVSSYQAMNGPGITTRWDGPMSFKTNVFMFRVDDVIATEKLPHSYLKDRAFHIVYMREGSPFYPYWIFHGPIDEFRSLVSKLQGKKILTLGWDIVPQDQ